MKSKKLMISKSVQQSSHKIGNTHINTHKYLQTHKKVEK